MRWNRSKTVVLILLLGMVLSYGTLAMFQNTGIESEFDTCIKTVECRNIVDSQIAEKTSFEWATSSTTQNETSTVCDRFTYYRMGGNVEITCQQDEITHEIGTMPVVYLYPNTDQEGNIP